VDSEEDLVSAAKRDPASCPHRQCAGPSEHNRLYCALAARLAGVACAVNDEVCLACCRHPLPAGDGKNPVIASLVHAGTERARVARPPGDPAQAAIDESRRFALRWLRGPGPDPADATPQITPRRRERQSRGPAPRPLRLGLVGCATRSGVGYLNCDVARHLGVDRWLVTGPDTATSGGLACRIDAINHELSPIELEAWLDGLDIVLFAESPQLTGLTAVARGLGVRVACIPQWEWLHPGLEWLDDVDLMLCPTRHTETRLADWTRRFGFRWAVRYVPWPIDLGRFRYRPRLRCRRFVFVAGSGGARAVRPAGCGELRRKGLAVLIEAARRVPGIPLLVYGNQRDVTLPGPPNIEWRWPLDDNTELYLDGDVCVQPSHWEGLGLPLLECQAAGMPLVTTDAPPMNEHQPLARIPAAQEAVLIDGRHSITAALIRPDDLAETLRSLHGRSIASASRRARRFVEREHGWHRARATILDALLSLLELADRDSPAAFV
jgi:glycosyltransferase involved in cell wall biosynthesis